MNKLIIAPVLAALSLAVMQSANASDGTITFNGLIQDITCTVNVNGSGSSTATITLPTISKSALATANSTAGDTPFSIALTGCTGTGVTAGKNVATYFEPGPNVNAAGRLNNTGVAGPNVNIALYLASAPTTPLNLGTVPTAPGHAQLAGATPAGTATMNYVAKYYAANIPVGTGAVASSVTYSIVYP